MVVYDPMASALAPGVVPAPFYVRITQALVRLLGERTADGYVLRVDLRLRPDPGSTAIAISVPAAFVYYETLGQNWERAAFIKARPVAGDLALGSDLSARTRAFRLAQILRLRGDRRRPRDEAPDPRLSRPCRRHRAGHDVKLGRGGIREIEFFVQTQQLIFGGRRPSLRGAATLDMLAELQADGWIDEVAVSELTAAYRFLRRIEHRLQMMADEQTQRLPVDPDALAQFALFAGYDDYAGFEADLLRQMRIVEAHYARLFEHAPGLDAAGGQPGLLGRGDRSRDGRNAPGLGFSKPAEAVEIVRGWHFGRRPAVRGARAREVLTELVPALLSAFSASGDPDAALARVRYRARPHAGGRRAVQHPEVECGAAPTLRRHPRRGAAPRRDRDAAVPIFSTPRSIPTGRSTTPDEIQARVASPGPSRRVPMA